ncbi:hypothetical protein KVH27_35190 [Streptomyces olivaceus]|uniref:hypothetical protein n=1 Tax=Streptomyces olivaceus TaxID=47716 RepID=UPI001CCA725B|nr:hypothetical protein [Streptomyces olivaceus]MBZ6253597.1 hypothetical protein [Streptomyces olivaceus]
MTVTVSGVAYTDPVQDALARDLDGTLWALCEGAATGKPRYAAELHPERQRVAMEGLLCACCRHPADRNEHGMLWVLPVPDDAVDLRWEGLHSAIPPMCEPCSVSVPLLCPRLRDGHVQLRVREAEPIGVRGTLHPRPGSQDAPDYDAFVRYDSPDMPFVVARQAVRELRRTTVVATAP